MRIESLRDLDHAPRGTVLDVPDAQGKVLLILGWAREIPTATAPEPRDTRGRYRRRDLRAEELPSGVDPARDSS